MKATTVTSSINGTETTVNLDDLAARLSEETQRAKQYLKSDASNPNSDQLESSARFFLTARAAEKKLTSIRASLDSMAQRVGLTPYQ